jgi:GAF domain-containing protein
MSNDEVLTQLAALAADIGPALAPPAHDELLESIAETARSLFGAAACSIALLEEGDERDRLTFRVAVGRGSESVVGVSIPSTDGVAGFVVRSGQPLLLEDVARDPRFAGSFAKETGDTPREIVAVPLETDRATLGVLEILDPDDDAVGRARGMELLGLFAGLASLAIESARVFRDLGTRLFVAAAATVGEQAPDLAHALTLTSEHAPKPQKYLADLASIFLELQRLGPEEREIVTTQSLAFLRYAAAAKGAR